MSASSLRPPNALKGIYQPTNEFSIGTKFPHFIYYRLPTASVVVTVGENQLNSPEIDGKLSYIVRSIIPYTADGGYNPETGLHNIALIQV